MTGLKRWHPNVYLVLAWATFLLFMATILPWVSGLSREAGLTESIDTNFSFDPSAIYRIVEAYGESMFKNDVNANPVWEPLIGFSDDDLRNIEKISELLNQEYEENPVNLYLTKGGEKTKY